MRRRRVLLAAPTGLTATLAGCPGDDGSSGNTTTATTPATDATFSSGYRPWLYEPGTVRDSEHYPFNYVNVEQVTANESEFSNGVYDAFTGAEQQFPFSQLGIALADIKTNLSFERGGTATADFDHGTAVDTLTNNGFSKDGTVGPFTRYRDGGKFVIGIAGDRLVYADGDAATDLGGVDYVRCIVDAEAGTVQRYHEADQDFATLTDRLGDGTVVSGNTHQSPEETRPDESLFQGVVASGRSITVDGATTEATAAFVFENASDVDMGAVGEMTDGPTFEGWRDVEASQDGRVVVVTAARDTEDWQFGPR
jgi:hypothetical protein